MNDVEYKEFEIKDIFYIVTGSLLKASSLEEGTLPRITATSTNNGVAMYTKKIKDKNFRVFNNFISVSFLGDVFYHTNNVSLDMKIHGLILKDYIMNKNLSLYLIPLIKKFSNKYEYGNQLSTGVLARQRIMLPITKKEKPDWEYMEEYIKKYNNDSSKKVLKFLYKDLEMLGHFKRVSLEEVVWKDYKINEVFSIIQRGKRLIKAHQTDGFIPYISSTALNNGVDNFISRETPKPNREFTNTITIANSGSVGKTFYHPYNFIASDHVTTLYKDDLNEYVALFLNTSIIRISNKYAFNREISDARIIHEKVMLPTLSNGKPDYIFMENYIKEIKYDSIMKSIKFIENSAPV